MKSKHSHDFVLPDYYNNSKPKQEKDLVKRKCFHCNKEALMDKFQRWCSAHCKYLATKDYDSHIQDDFKVRR
jgi:hypothetical protein